ncbi:hypothetical protein HKBW3S03_00551 [Candidatus Hakubella thermalkaliphila]|uniref:Uncharacterized protein n=1 Tax=Candidatus Hakubella thermalkaliphila TaxID=2754717 RepID=A0A6V8PYX2_9ACTN|nr:hypothetical protein [Candidatus Hakubella thermalkaliphila]GFP19047.1 hypothetical protein HKBW3S03_00551 [Candidatus Hakubella thermalkaliphila]GFP37410.1 hypothetical protein HKBW3S44_01090 [Candidatus Hakubella thermalkaliphila]
MFLRSTAKKVKGKTYRYWKLVENVRTERGVCQRVVAHLGDLASFRAEDWQALAERMGGKLSVNPVFTWRKKFPLPPGHEGLGCVLW